MMARLDQAAAVARRSPPAVVEVLSQRLCRTIVEMIAAQHRHLIGEGEEALIAARLEVGESCLQ